LLIATTACSTRNQEHAQADADKAKADAKRAGEEIKMQAKDLSHKVSAAVQPDSVSASEKMNRAEADARTAADHAGIKLDHAALLAKVKTKLASNAGLSTLTNIDVSVDGSVAILSGSVDTEDQKKAAETAASEVNGITRVDNRLTVR
jgi:osmotically-inducible protein OsmY